MTEHEVDFGRLAEIQKKEDDAVDFIRSLLDATKAGQITAQSLTPLERLNLTSQIAKSEKILGKRQVCCGCTSAKQSYQITAVVGLVSLVVIGIVIFLTMGPIEARENYGERTMSSVLGGLLAFAGVINFITLMYLARTRAARIDKTYESITELREQLGLTTATA
ncbi:hypothetical protein HK102_000983 [Quaeritorhiza haematococci]|nr:hypothetical protein HK102_000983 [Quaeritorhiza haematococci]